MWSIGARYLRGHCRRYFSAWDRIGVESYETLTTIQRASCEQFRDRPFIGTKNEEGTYEWMNYGEFGENVDRLALAMGKSMGVKPGDKVAVISKNRLEWALAAYACFRNGAHFVPMYEQQHPEDWTYILSDSGASHLFVSTLDILSKTRELGLAPSKDNVKCFDLDDEDDDASFRGLLRTGRELSERNVSLDVEPPTSDDLCVLIYTSGTTGRPKGVMLSHGNVASNVRSCREIFEHRLDHADTGLGVLPWAHVFGQTLDLHTTLSAGGRLGIVESRETLAGDLKTVGPSVMCGVPLIFKIFYDRIQSALEEMTGPKRAVTSWALSVARERRRVFDEGRGGTDPWVALKWALAKRIVIDKITENFGGNLRCAFTGGAKLEEEIQTFFGDLGIPIIEGYGLTETSPVIVTERYGPTEKTQGGLRAAPGGVKVFITEPETANVLPPNQEGEIVCVGPNVMQGYHAKPDATDEVIFDLNGERAFRTGDLGRLTEEGVLTITGRCKELYKLRNGKYVVPTQVEEHIALSRFVSQAMLFGADKDYNVALLNVDLPLVASEIGLATDGMTNEDISSHASVVEFVEKEMDRMSETNQKSYEWPRRFRIVPENFSVENGLLTPKLSMKRNVIVDAYRGDLEGMYTEDGEGEN